MVLAIAAGKPLLTARYYAVDGVTGKVAGFVDHSDPSHVFAQGTSALQVALPTGDVAFNGALVATCAAAYYESNRAAGSWNYCIDGSGVNTLHVYAHDATPGIQVLSCANRNNVAGNGTNFYTSGATSTNQLTRNGAANVVSQNEGSGPAIGAPTYATQMFWIGAGAGVEQDIWRKGTRAVVGTYTPPAASTAPDRPMGILGGNPLAAAFPFQGRWAASAFTLPWTAPQRDVWQRYVQSAYGIAA
jgi:hypothetical protein